MKIKSLLYPKKCIGCGCVLKQAKVPFCWECNVYVKRVIEPLCKVCGKPLGTNEAVCCTDCQKNKRLITQNKSLYVYDGPIRDSIYRLKYANEKWIGSEYGRQFAKSCFNWIRANEIKAVIPVPISKERLKKRGYNQAYVIARALVKSCNKALGKNELFMCEGVTRTKETTPQKELNTLIRRKNLKKAFKLNKSVVELNGISKMLIVDDIFTTGSTLDAISDVLLESGIKGQIYAATIAIGSDIDFNQGV